MSPKPKKRKFKKILFKLSDKQYSIVMRFSKSKKLTPNKVFKKAIKDYIVNNYDFNDTNYQISENQLAMFDLDDELVDNTEALDENTEDFIENKEIPKTTLF